MICPLLFLFHSFSLSISLPPFPLTSFPFFCILFILCLKAIRMSRAFLDGFSASYLFLICVILLVFLNTEVLPIGTLSFLIYMPIPLLNVLFIHLTFLLGVPIRHCFSSISEVLHIRATFQLC